MSNRTRTRFYTRWRSTIAPGHCTNDRESYTVHKPFSKYMDSAPVVESMKTAQAQAELAAKELSQEDLAILLSKNKSFRITKQKGK